MLPVAVYAALMVGVRLADTPTRAAARRAKIEALTVRVPVVDLGPAIAEEWARLFATLSRRGELMPANEPGRCGDSPAPGLQRAGGAVQPQRTSTESPTST